jgi:hypothetical protein
MPAGDFLFESKDLQIFSCCRLQLGLEGGEEPDADAARTLPSPSILRPGTDPDPQWLLATLLTPQN